MLASTVQIWAAAATTGAAVIALVVAVSTAVQRRRDQKREDDRETNRARAQARLVAITANVNLAAHEQPPGGVLRLNVGNHGDRALLDAAAEGWREGAPLDGPPTDSRGPEVVRVHQGSDFLFIVKLADQRTTPAPSLAAWRVRWTDADGRRWCVDGQPQDAPGEFTGQPPRPY